MDDKELEQTLEAGRKAIAENRRLLDDPSPLPVPRDIWQGEREMLQITQELKQLAQQCLTPSRGAKIRTLREKCGWTIEQLAEKVGLSDRQVRRHEHDKGIRPDSLRTYRDVFKAELKREIEL